MRKLGHGEIWETVRKNLWENEGNKGKSRVENSWKVVTEKIRR